MIRLNVKELMEKNNMSKYKLHTLIGMSYQNFSKMIDNKTKSIKYETIDALCAIFDCTPNELFVFEPDKLQDEE